MGILSLWSCVSNEKEAGSGRISHVVVIGFDGLSPNGIKMADTPTFDHLIKEGASTMHARAVLPTSSSSNWASMIMGAGPEQHGITSNDWEKENFILPAVTQSEEFLFPTIFNLIDSKIANAEVGAIYHWSGFGRLFEKNAVDFETNPLTEEETVVEASSYLKDKTPDFTFIHFDHVDHAGHEFGHGSKEYYSAVEKADSLLSRVMDVIESSKMKNNTLVIISADHGGMGKGHGGESLQEIEIPFLVWGTDVKKGYRIKNPVYQYDNAATVAYALGLNTPAAWIGKPVKEVFEGFEANEDYPLIIWESAPRFYPPSEGFKKAGGLFSNNQEIRVENPNNSGQLRYTLDGKMPSRDSKPYDGPIPITENSVVSSAVFNNEKITSLVSEAFVRIKPSDKKPPVAYEIFYLENLSFLPSLDNRTPNEVGSVFEITSDEIKDKIKANTAARFRSTIDIPENNKYTFFTRSDDGSKLFIDGGLLVDNDGDHGVREKSGSKELEKGNHIIEVLWFNGGGNGWLDVYIQSEKLVKQIVPTTMMFGKEH